jgi:hypothetical protein
VGFIDWLDPLATRSLWRLAKLFSQNAGLRLRSFDQLKNLAALGGVRLPRVRVKNPNLMCQYFLRSICLASFQSPENGEAKRATIFLVPFQGGDVCRDHCAKSSHVKPAADRRTNDSANEGRCEPGKVAFHGSNETELSRRWREQALLLS